MIFQRTLSMKVIRVGAAVETCGLMLALSAIMAVVLMMAPWAPAVLSFRVALPSLNLCVRLIIEVGFEFVWRLDITSRKLPGGKWSSYPIRVGVKSWSVQSHAEEWKCRRPFEGIYESASFGLDRERERILKKLQPTMKMIFGLTAFTFITGVAGVGISSTPNELIFEVAVHLATQQELVAFNLSSKVYYSRRRARQVKSCDAGRCQSCLLHLLTWSQAAYASLKPMFDFESACSTRVYWPRLELLGGGQFDAVACNAHLKRYSSIYKLPIKVVSTPEECSLLLEGVASGSWEISFADRSLRPTGLQTLLDTVHNEGHSLNLDIGLQHKDIQIAQILAAALPQGHIYSLLIGYGNGTRTWPSIVVGK